MHPQPFVSIIIPVFRNWDSLALCLQALANQSYPVDRFEIIVVNNDPEDKPQVPETLPNQRLINEHTPGSYAARNTGIRAAQGELLGFCDADCIPGPAWIEQAVQFLGTNPHLSRAAGKVELLINGLKGSKPNYAQLYETIFAFRQEEYAQNGSSATANMFSYCRVFKAVGLFREDLLSGGDLEWSRRAQSGGWRIGYAPQVVVHHPARNSVPELAAKAKRVCSGYIHLNNADFKNNLINAVYHGLCMLKPPLQAGKMIFGRTDLRLQDKLFLYFLEYYLKLVQLWEYTQLQMGKSGRR